MSNVLWYHLVVTRPGPNEVFEIFHYLLRTLCQLLKLDIKVLLEKYKVHVQTLYLEGTTCYCSTYYLYLHSYL